MTELEDLKTLHALIAEVLRTVSTDTLKAELARREGEPERRGFKRVKVRGTH